MTRSEAETRLQALPIESYCIGAERWWRRTGSPAEYEVDLCIYEERFSATPAARFKGPTLANVVEQAEAKFAPGYSLPDESMDDADEQQFSSASDAMLAARKAVKP